VKSANAGEAIDNSGFTENGQIAALCGLIATTGTAVTTALAGREWDVVVIGGGVRKADPLVPLLEQVVSLVRRRERLNAR
jgi:hypothetical protein